MDLATAQAYLADLAPRADVVIAINWDDPIGAATALRVGLAARKAAGQLGPGNYRATVAMIDVLHDYAAATAKGG